VKKREGVIKSKKFLEMIENAVNRYQNNLLTTAQIIEELRALLKKWGKREFTFAVSA
jgi:type I restriction enzyme R subunit